MDRKEADELSTVETQEPKLPEQLPEKQPDKQPGQFDELKDKVREQLTRFWNWAKVKPQTAILGEFLYNLGLWGEFTGLQIVRGIRDLIFLVGGRAGAIFKLAGDYIMNVLRTCWYDLSAPFRKLGSACTVIRDIYTREKAQPDGHPFKACAAYFARGTHKNASLMKGALAYVMPVLAAGLFLYTVNMVMNYNYALAVEVNGEVVGYVANEQVFDEAAAEIAQRIKPINGEKLDWKIEPSYTVAVSDKTMTVNITADSILRASSDEIVDATALYVNGSIVAVTQEGDKLRNEIKALKAPYEDPTNPNLRVEFTKDITTEDGIYSAQSLSSAAQIVDMLKGEEQGQITYVVQKGDSPSAIASANGLSTQQLADMNPQQDIYTQLHIGDELIIQKSMPYLEVRRIERVTTQEPIKFNTVVEKDSSMNFGNEKVVQNGEEGIDEVVYDRYYYGDSTQPSEVYEISRTTLKEPVNKVIKRGTKMPDGNLAQTGSGTLLWPVPNYKGVSRWMTASHKGADIRANYGTPILASDAGVVVTATYHYSYGNYVVIDHGNGFQTLYAHASRLAVQKGQSVSQGQVIAYVGSTGNSTGNHCHYEIHKNGVRINPKVYFPNK